MKEIWKEISGYDGKYWISNYGRVKSLYKHNGTEDRLLSIMNDKNGYSQVLLRNNGKQKCERVHRLAATAFLPNIENKRTVNHKDCNKHNNVVTNLEWATYKENAIHAFNNGLNNSPIVQKNNMHSKRVVQMNFNNEILSTFDSISDAARITGLDRSGIGRCCSGNLATSKGFKWRYA